MRYLLLLVTLLYANLLIAQTTSPQDCVGAVTICSNDTITTPSMPGQGNVDDLEYFSSCFALEESNAIWFEFVIDQSGWLVFSITPIGFLDDYDFALFQPDTFDCDLIGRRSVRCNFAASPGMVTGLKVGETDTLADVSGDAWLAPIYVTSGEKYYLLVDSYTDAGSGFKLTTGGSTASFAPDTNITGIADIVYDTTANAFLLELDDAVSVSSISNDLSEFKITGPLGVLTVSNVSYDTLYLRGADVFSKSFMISTLEPVTQLGVYLLQLMQGTDGDVLLGSCLLSIPYNSRSFLVLAAEPEDTLSAESITPSFAQQVQVFPNPTKDVLYITTELPNGTAWSASLFDLNGKQISATEVSTQSHRVDVSDLPNGTYLLMCSSALGTYQQKVVVLR